MLIKQTILSGLMNDYSDKHHAPMLRIFRDTVVYGYTVRATLCEYPWLLTPKQTLISLPPQIYSALIFGPLTRNARDVLIAFICVF